MALDITDQKDAAVLAFTYAPEGLMYSEQRVIKRANEAFASMFSLLQHEVEGLSIELLYPSHADSERRVAIWGPALQCTGVYADERVMVRRDGQLFWCGVKGRSLTPPDPFARAIWSFTDLSEKWNLPRLAARDREIAVLICEGRTAKEIARQLSLSPRTVEAYLARLKRKLQVRNAAELVGRLRAEESLAHAP